MTTTHAVCAECKSEFDYELKPGYPRKYCPNCSAKKKARFENRKPDVQGTFNKVMNGTPTNTGINSEEAPVSEIKKPTGEYQSLVYNKTLCANSYEVGSAGDRFKIYFEDVKDLQAKLKELKDAGLMNGPEKEMLV